MADDTQEAKPATVSELHQKFSGYIEDLVRETISLNLSLQRKEIPPEINPTAGVISGVTSYLCLLVNDYTKPEEEPEAMLMKEIGEFFRINKVNLAASRAESLAEFRKKMN